MAACLTALLLICAAFGRPAPASSAYMGKDLRNLHTFDHEVAGHVYALDATTLLVTGFKYDGSAPDAYFWVGSTTSPSSNGIIVPDEAGRSQPLGRYDGSKDLILKLPANLKLGEIKWLSVWCKKFAVDFGNVVFGTIAGPAPRDIGAMKPGDHGTQASAITLLNEKTLHLTNLMYDGTSADAFFVVRKSDGTDMKVRDENNSLTKLHAYTGQNVTLTLPESVSFFDVDYFKIGCVACSEAHGMVAIPASVKVPGTLPSSMANNAAPMKNCETLLDGIFNVEWKINGNVIRFTLTGQAEPGTYLSFGLSGSMTATSMISSDAIVAWIDKTTAQPRAMDYNLGAYSQCANMRGVCPDPELGGANDVMDIVGSFKDGATTISFSRRLNTDNELDKAYLTSAYDAVRRLGDRSH
ncbi:PREDICTED: protein Skeletor, isoforms B/C-like [Priapulus caudatus]|uniref:Protein Skeletor, isoforms B/C-like n=1 Tax=Priapulus caudatus TaxID=37621 RepID=A0ABM1DQS1_PRICU|nr:PREDICTED: protein Skeletor, isoforms B/C-like [Priapulus caudatus]